MTISDVAYLGANSPKRAARIELLETHKLSTSETPGAQVTVLDGTKLGDAELDTLLAETGVEDTAVLVLFTLSHGISFRDRREALIKAGARDVMAAEASDDEFLTRVRALIHLSRPPRLLVVEDEDEIGDWVEKLLTDAGMEVSRARNLAEAEARFEAGPVDALIVDRKLPDGDGLEMVARLRDHGIRTPALLLSALASIEDRIRGLQDARADDYICKPVHEDELLARVHVLLRPRTTEDILVFGPLEVNRRDRIIRWRGDRISLRRKEGEMLIYLAERAGLPIPQRMIYLDVWEKVFMDFGSTPVTAARHRLVRDIKAFLKERGEAYPEFVETKDDAYVFQPDLLLRLPDRNEAGA